MTKLDCNVVTCTYNSNKKCKRDNITVAGNEAIKPSETACESFYPRGTNTMTNLDNDGPKTALNVACKAVTCVYNKDKKCSAEHILIGGTHAVATGETECGTFQCR